MKAKLPPAARIIRTSLLLATLAWPWVAGAATVVAPNALESVEGNANNVSPFAPANLGSVRYQQAYGSGEFSSVPGPFYITGMAFRLDGPTTAPFSGNISDIELRFSTTSRSVDALSTTFASNIGADELTVYNGALTLSAIADGPPGGPHSFGVLMSFSTPFLYNPAQGNLLLDVFNQGGNTMLRAFDAANTFGDGISRVRSANTGSVNDPTGTADTIGLVTRFTVQAIPEPQVLSLGLLAVGALGLCRWRRLRC